MEAARNSQSMIKRHLSAYVLSMCIIAALVMSVLYFNKIFIERHEDDAAILNRAGRQRMLSQRAAKEVLLLLGARSEGEKGKYRGELLNTKNELADGYRLFTGEVEKKLAGEDMLERIDGLYAQFIEQIETALQAGVISGQRPAMPGNLIDASTAYVDAIDRVNALLVKDQEGKHIGYLRYNLGFDAVILAMLSLTLLFIYFPLIRKYKAVLGSYEESKGTLLAEIEARKQVEEVLKQHRSHLEEKVAERTATLRELNKELNGKVEELNDVLETLMESEVRYRTVMENMPDAVVIIDLEAEGGVVPIVDINENGLAMHGYRREELIGKDISILQSAQDKVTRAELLPGVLAGEDVGIIAVEHIKRDGSKLPLEVRVKPVILGGRKHLLAIERDISARLAQIDALQKSENNFRNLVENINDWVWEVDRDGVYTYASPGVQNLLGYSPEEVIGKTPFDLMPMREANIMRVAFGTIVALEKPFTGLESINLHKDGHEVVLEASGRPIFGKDGELVGYRGADRDITKEKTDMDGLRNLKNAINNIAEMIILTDMEGIVKYANLAFLDKSGFSGEVIGGKINQVLPFGDIFQQGMSIAAKSRKPWAMPVKSSTVKGGHREYEVLISPVPDDEGWIVNCIIVLRDVTDEKELRSKLAHSEKLSAIGTFVSGVAHELNNPLMSILGFSRSIVEDHGGEFAPEVRKDIGMIVKESRRAVRIVKDLLQYSKKSAAGSLKTVEINQVMDAALQACRNIFADGRVKLRRNGGNDAIYVFADDIKLQQVFINILSNAGNQIRKTKDAGAITVSTELNNGQAIINIENDGPSIPEGDIDKIFDPFFTSGDGMGLGLFLSSKIITEHNGSIIAENLNPAGVRFRITFGMTADAASNEGESAESSRKLAKPVAMLVVDDNRQIRDWFKNHFGKKNNIAITVAANGAEAVGAIQEHEYDVILSDIKMPVMGGLALKNWLMENRPECLERLVLMSGLVDEKVESDARQAGCQYLQKPFEKEELVEVISRISARGGGVRIII